MYMHIQTCKYGEQNERKTFRERGNWFRDWHTKRENSDILT